MLLITCVALRKGNGNQPTSEWRSPLTIGALRPVYKFNAHSIYLLKTSTTANTLLKCNFKHIISYEIVRCDVPI